MRLLSVAGYVIVDEMREDDQIRSVRRPLPCGVRTGRREVGGGVVCGTPCAAGGAVHSIRSALMCTAANSIAV